MHEANATKVAGSRLIASDGRELPLVRTAIRVEAGGGLARVTVEQTFSSSFGVALEARYQLPLPADGVVSGFAFRMGETRIEGRVEPTGLAREQYERGLVEGRTVALLEEVRADVFEERLGNIPPGTKVVAEVTVDQKLTWLAEGQWEWRFPSVLGPRFLGEPGRVSDADRILVDVSAGPLAHRIELALAVRDELSGRPESPSHAIETKGGAIALAESDGVRADRDLVVRWPVHQPKVGVRVDAMRRNGHAFGLVTVVPPRDPQAMRPVARDLIFLLDVSGSMSGRPLQQARRVVSAMIDTLEERDRLELIAFASAPVRFAKQPIAATAEGRRKALAWVAGLEAGGSTEMMAAILEALGPLRADAQRQVVLVTDGYIGFEAQVLAAARAKLPRGSRVHTLGVGSAVNRALTQPLARLGGGVEVIVGLGEDPERAARRLVERTSAPLFVDVSVEGSAVVGTASRRLPDLFAHAPALIPAELRPEGGEIVVTGRIAGGERFVHRSQVARFDGSAALAALWARERVADLDADERQDEEIERLGVTFQIATRKTAFVAVSRERTVSGDERTTVRLPHELPYGMSIEGLGLRAGGWGVTTTGRMTRVGGVVDARTMVAADSGIPVMGPSAAPQMAEPAEPPLVPKRGWLPTFFVLLLIAFVIALLAVLLWP